MTFSNHGWAQVLGKAAGSKCTKSGEQALTLLLRPLGSRFLPFSGFFFQLFSPGLVALLGGARFLVDVVMMASGVCRESGS